MTTERLENLWERAKRDDAWQTIVPSEIRELVYEVRGLRKALAGLLALHESTCTGEACPHTEADLARAFLRGDGT